jgi:CRP-like cAMP-binding protein
MIGRMLRKPSSTKPGPPPFDVRRFLDSTGIARRILRFPRGSVVFAQGAPANSVFYIQDGR